jgi:hypothetical protein
MQAQEERPKLVSWNDSAKFAEDFGRSFTNAKEHLKACRLNKKQVVYAFDEMADMYRVIVPYCKNEPIEKELKIEFLALEQAVNLFFSKSNSFQEKNFSVIFSSVNSFLSKLVDVGVQKNFFPKPTVTRTNKDIVEALKQS